MLDPKKFEELTKDSVLRNRTPLELFSYYIPQFKELGKRFCSDLRKDSTPSCVIYEQGLYVDFGTGERHDVFSYLQAKYMCSFHEVLQIINNDFNLNLGQRAIAAPVFFGIKPKKEVEIKFKSIPFTEKALSYYKTGGITKEILEEYWHKQLEAFWVNDKYFSVKDQLCFLQPEIRKSDWVYKIYMPEKPKGQRFPVSNDGGAIYGLRQLPEKGEKVFITSSKKDIMTLRALGYWAISGTSESVFFTQELIDYLRSKFQKVYMLYDFDDKGIAKANEINTQFGLDGCIFTSNKEFKDPFAYVARFSQKSLKRLIDNGTRSI